jgi:hypothetical protein
MTVSTPAQSLLHQRRTSDAKIFLWLAKRISRWTPGVLLRIIGLSLGAIVLCIGEHRMRRLCVSLACLREGSLLAAAPGRDLSAWSGVLGGWSTVFAALDLDSVKSATFALP